jgi:palmitoyltransferase
MDHYCIWVVNTVGLLNYKYFVQFMAYTFLACLVALVVLIHPMIEFFKGQQDTA